MMTFGTSTGCGTRTSRCFKNRARASTLLTEPENATSTFIAFTSCLLRFLVPLATPWRPSLPTPEVASRVKRSLKLPLQVQQLQSRRTERYSLSCEVFDYLLLSLWQLEQIGGG